MKYGKLLLILFLFNFTVARSQIILSEYCCSNLATTTDNFNEFEDWVELYNSSFNTVNLSGYYLSDNVEDPLKWKIPAGVNIAGNGFLVVWASGRNIFSGGFLHASFKLTQSKKNPDWLVLSNPSGALLEKVQIKRHQKGHSVGKVAGNWQIFPTSTPGVTNNGTFKIAYAAAPVFVKSPGFYPGTFRLYLTTTEPNSRIYYSIDGSNPLMGGLLYNSSGIQIDSTRVVKAVTYSYNSAILSSFLSFGTFFINVNHTMPVISISGKDLNTLANGNNTLKPEGSFEFFDKYRILKETAYGDFNSHGQDSWANDQRSLDYKTRDEMGYNDAIHEKLFSLSHRKEFQGIILRAAGDDNYPAAHHSSNAGSAHIRDAYVQNMAIQGGLAVDARTGEKAIVYLNGKYWGVYDMRERADEQDYTKFYYNQDKYHLQYIETWGNTWAEYGGNQAITDWSALRTYIMNNNMAVPANYKFVTDKLDVKSLVDYAIVNSVSVCSDWLNYNTGWWRGLDPKGGHKKWGYTLWDNDAVFGFYINYTGIPSTAYTALPCNIESTSLDDPEGHIEIIKKLKENPGFNQFYISRYIDLFNTTFSCSNMLYNLDSIITLLTPEMTKHADRWFGTFTEWSNNKNTLRNYVSNRCNVLSSGLNTCYNLSGPYNTTFKTMPAGSGAIQVNSMVFSNLPYTGRYHGKIDVLLKAIPDKNYIFEYWTAGIDTFKTATALANAILRIAGTDTIVAHFTPRTVWPKLNITEINYKPEATLQSGTWFELTNYGNATIDVSGWRIVQGDWRNYEFPSGTNIPAGAHWIFSSDSARFNQIYKNNSWVKKYVLFDLSTENEPLRLLDTGGTEFLHITYDNKQPWPIAADGVGRTLELKHDTLNASVTSNWRNGCVGGTPGAAFQNCNEPFIVSEINYNSGQLIDAGTWIELLNTTNQNISLAGYSFRNNKFESKYTIPAGTVLNANARLVLCNDKLKFEKYFPVQNVIELKNFSLGNSGDELKFYNTADTLVFSVVYEDTLAFNKLANGTGFTLDYNFGSNDYSQGGNWNIACKGGSPNSVKGTCVSAAIFTEVNYKSAIFHDAGDWFEIKNKGNAAINLKGWQFTDSTTAGFRLTTNQIINPNEYLVVVSDSVKFKKMYPHVKNYVGDLNFNLSSGGEKLKIFDSLNNYVALLDYNDSIPWPSRIDGYGYTMELKYDTSDFNIGSRWKRSCLGGSPGNNYLGCSDSVIISEFNYSSNAKADAGDWVELWNKGAFTTDISGWLFQDNDLKDTFLIPANTHLKSGDRLVLVNDSNKFKLVYPGTTNFIGNFSFGLSSIADFLVLRDAGSKLKFGMSYSIDSTWDPLATGAGYTLELITDTFDRSNAVYWKSKCPGGSPGKASGSCDATLVITEINYKSDVVQNSGDWFELFNNGTVPVNLSSFYLTNADSTVKASIGNTTTLLFPKEYMVLCNDTGLFTKYFAHVSGKMKVSFALKDTGDTIKLYDAQKKPILSAIYSSNMSWPESVNGNGMTLEKINYNSSSNTVADWETGCFGGSPGTAKQSCMAALVISEINYKPHPVEDDGQWIEFKNNSATDSIYLPSYFLQVFAANKKIAITKSVKLPPKSFFVIASDSMKFNTYHQVPQTNIMYYQGLLLNANTDALGIYDNNNKKLYHAAFHSNVTNLAPANGNAYTLEFIDSGKIYNHSKDWFVGCRHGSPGKNYGVCISPVMVSEINYKSHPKFDMGQWLELHNKMDYALDMSGWILQNTTATQRLPSNSILPANGYMVIGNRIQALKNAYNLNGVATDSLRLNLLTTDTVRVYTSDSSLIVHAAYSNAANWPQADATAYTLEYNDTAQRKYRSGCPGGSPGTALKPCLASMQFTEINYNSHQKNLSNDWVELLSTSKIPFAPEHWKISVNDSINFNASDMFNLLFKGERLVLVRSAFEFSKTHTIVNVLENTRLNLPDTNAVLRIFTAANLLLDSVQYQNAPPWNVDANHTGRTLELVNNNDNSLPQNWVAGCLGGTPGFAYSVPCVYNLPVTEINYHSLPAYNAGDWLELHNTTGVAINAGNMKVKSQNYVGTIPMASSIPAGGYLVLAKSKTLFQNVFPGVQNVIEMSPIDLSDGDKVELYDSIGNIVYYVHYDTLIPWPLNTNKGYTLEYRDTATNPWQPSSWFRSCFAGTPGRNYSLPCDINGVSVTKQSNEVQIYPNPSTGIFNVHIPLEGLAIVFDLNGKEVLRKYLHAGQNEITLKESRGMYLICIYTEEGCVRRKIVVE